MNFRGHWSWTPLLPQVTGSGLVTLLSVLSYRSRPGQDAADYDRAITVPSQSQFRRPATFTPTTSPTHHLQLPTYSNPLTTSYWHLLLPYRPTVHTRMPHPCSKPLQTSGTLAQGVQDWLWSRFARPQPLVPRSGPSRRR